MNVENPRNGSRTGKGYGSSGYEAGIGAGGNGFAESGSPETEMGMGMGMGATGMGAGDPSTARTANEGPMGGQDRGSTLMRAREAIQTRMDGKTLRAHISPSHIAPALGVIQDFEVAFTPTARVDQKIVQDSLAAGAVAGAVLGLSLGMKVGIAGGLATAIAAAFIRVCEVRLNVDGAPEGQSLLNLSPSL